MSSDIILHNPWNEAFPAPLFPAPNKTAVTAKDLRRGRGRPYIIAVILYQIQIIIMVVEDIERVFSYLRIGSLSFQIMKTVWKN